MITDIKKYKILKEGRSIDISIEETKKYIENKNIDLNNLKNIYRGTYSDHTSKYLFIDPKLHNRASANTFNYYTLIMDNNELWKEYPKRSKSLVCTTSISTSYVYTIDEPYLVIPLDKNANFGICSQDDLWHSFEYFKSKMKYEFTMDMFCEKLHDNNISKLSYNDMLNDLKNKTLGELFTNYCLDSYKNQIFNVNDLNPKANKFKLIKYNEIVDSLYSDKELWTDSECLLISVKGLDNNINLLK